MLLRGYVGRIEFNEEGRDGRVGFAFPAGFAVVEAFAGGVGVGRGRWEDVEDNEKRFEDSGEEH